MVWPAAAGGRWNVEAGASLALVGRPCGPSVTRGAIGVARLRAGQPLDVSFRAVLGAYFYSMSIVSLVILAIGLTSLLKAGLSDRFGRGFSCAMPPLVGPIAPPAPPPFSQSLPGQPLESSELLRRQLDQVERQYQSDLVQGGTLATAGLVVWALHTWGRRRVIRSGDALVTFLSRGHLAILLLLFGITGLISLAMGIYQVLLFALVATDEFVPRQPPGEAAAMAIVFVLLWMIALAIALREMRSSEGR